MLPDHTSLRAALLALALSLSVAVEHPRDYNMGICAAGVPVRGRGDIFDWGRNAVIDLKSCKTFRYCQTPDELARNVQLAIYAKYGLARDLLTPAKPVRLVHAYVRTDGSAEHKIVETVVTPDEVDSVYSGVEQSVTVMDALAHTKPSYHEVPMNTEACNDYGGCPYAATCGVVIRAKVQPEVPPKDVAVQTAFPPEAPTLADRLKAAREAPRPIATGINPPDANYYVQVIDPKPTEWKMIKNPVPDLEPVHLDLHLYIDCAPRRKRTEVIHLDEEIAQRGGVIAALAGVNHVSEIEFGKGRAALVAGFARNPPRGTVLARSGGLSDAVIEVLAPMASEVYGPA